MRQGSWKKAGKCLSKSSCSPKQKNKAEVPHTRNGAHVHVKVNAAFRYICLLSTRSSLLRISSIFCSNGGSQAYSFKT